MRYIKVKENFNEFALQGMLFVMHDQKDYNELILRANYDE